MKQPMFRLIICCLVLGVSSPAWATTYYVATTGSDSSTCTQAQTITTPKLTVAAGITCLQADPLGNTLYIRAGTYTNQGISSNAQLIPSGTSWADAPRIAAYPGEVVTMNGQINLPASYIQYLQIEGLVMDGGFLVVGIGGGPGTPHHIKFVNMEIKNGSHQCVTIGGLTHHIWFTGGKIHDCGLSEPPAQAGYIIYMSGDDNIIENMELYNVNRFGIHNYDPTNRAERNIVRCNLIHDTGLLEPSSGAILITTGNDNQVYDNVLYSNKGHGVQLNSGTNNQVYNNTIYNGLQTGVQIQANAINAIVRNNILYNNAGGTISDVGTGTIKDHNLTTDPLFVNAATQDFHLQAGSAAINTGVTLLSVTTDFDGVLRPQRSAYDIGAYEFGGAPLDTTPPAIPTRLQIR